MNELQTKKHALVAESEVLRETLKLELHNLRLYGTRTKQKFRSFASPNRLLVLLAPLAGMVLRKRRSSSLIRRLLTGLISYQVSNRLIPFLSGFFSSKQSGGHASAFTDEPYHARKF